MASMRSPTETTAWTLVTAPDERDRCCVMREGRRCDRPTAFRVAGAGGELDDYTYVCAQDLELVRKADDVVVPVTPE